MGFSFSLPRTHFFFAFPVFHNVSFAILNVAKQRKEFECQCNPIYCLLSCKSNGTASLALCSGFQPVLKSFKKSFKTRGADPRAYFSAPRMFYTLS